MSPAAVPVRVLVVGVLVVTISTLPVFLLGASFVQMGPEFGFGPTGLGFITGAFFLASAAASTPLGRFVERVGWQRAMRLNAVASGALLVSIGLAARNLAGLTALLLAAAAVYGMSNPAANKALAAHGDPRRRALVFGLKHAGIPGSTLLAGLAVPVIVVTAGWRSAYVAGSAIAAVVYMLVPRTAPRALTTEPDPKRRVEPLTRQQLVSLAAGSALATWGPVALAVYVVAAAVEAGFSTSAAGLLLFGGSAASILARIAAGAVTDRLGGRGFAGVATLTGVGAAVFAALTISSGVGFTLLVITAFATGWGWPGLMTFTVVNANAATVAASSAITQAGVFVGAGVGPFVLGWLVGRWGFDAAWFFAAAGLALSTVAVARVGARATATQES